jgi:hypothetical protein
MFSSKESDKVQNAETDYGSNDDLNPGELTFEEGLIPNTAVCSRFSAKVSADTAGGLGRHLGITTCTLLMCVR